MTVVLERVVRRASLAVRITDLATGRPVTARVVVTAWPVADPALRLVAPPVNGDGVTGFATLPGMRPFENGSTARDDWFSSPPVRASVPMVVRVEDPSRTYLPVLRQVFAPAATPVRIALPRGPASAVPSGQLSIVAQLVEQSGAPAAWAVVEVSTGDLVTGGVADARGMLALPVARAVPPTRAGTARGGPVWVVTVRVRYRPADQHAAPGAATGDPPDIASLLTQPLALIDDSGALVGSIERELTSGTTLVLGAAPPLAPTPLVVRPTP